MSHKILLLLCFAFGLQNGIAQLTISDSLPQSDLHEIDCAVPNDNGHLTLSFSKDTVIGFHYANRAADVGKCEIQADRHAVQGSYGPAPIWIDSIALTKIKLLVYDGYDWSEQPVWARIKGGLKAPEIQFSGPTQTLCNGNAKLPRKLILRRSPLGWVCKVPVK